MATKFAALPAPANCTPSLKDQQLCLVDALPYIDSEYDEPGMKEMVGNMIEEEKRRYRPTKNYLEHLPPIDLHRFETEILKKEYERMHQRQPMEVLSMKRYELPPPPPGKLTDITAWMECLENSCAQLEHQAVRISNLEIMLDYGPEAWKSYLTVLVNMNKVAQKELSEIKKQVQEINWTRKSSQTQAAEQLKRLEASWVGLISKNYEIETAIIGKNQELYEKRAELAQRKFILAELESERGGARQRRRIKRLHLQDPQVIQQELNKKSKLNEPQPTEEEGEEEDDEDESEDEEDDDETVVPFPDSSTVNTVPIPIEHEAVPISEMSTDAIEEDMEEDEDDEEEIGPQPYAFPDADKYANDPEGNDDDSNSMD